MNAADIIFPNIGLKLQNISPVAFSIFGIEVYWYGVIIGLGVIAGLYAAMSLAKRSGQDPSVYVDFLMYALIFAIIGARLYYVLFTWEDYKDNLLGIFNTRQGGLAIYGGVIAAVITLIVFTRKRKLKFGLLADTAAPGLILGQAIGRWGNFINMEAFGDYTNNLLAMMLKKSEVKYIPVQVLDKIQTVEGVEYLQVHPTFLYESLWNLGVFIFLFLYYKRKKFNGEIFTLYILGYALGRVWIEGIRTDQLLISGTSIPISQLIAALSIVISLIYLIYMRRKVK